MSESFGMSMVCVQGKIVIKELANLAYKARAASPQLRISLEHGLLAQIHTQQIFLNL